MLKARETVKGCWLSSLLRHPLGQTAHPHPLGQTTYPIIPKHHLCPGHQWRPIFRSTSSNNPTGCTWLWRPLSRGVEGVRNERMIQVELIFYLFLEKDGMEALYFVFCIHVCEGISLGLTVLSLIEKCELVGSGLIGDDVILWIRGLNFGNRSAKVVVLNRLLLLQNKDLVWPTNHHILSLGTNL
ncbi:uncharacterized protein PGTG_00619 [Puccinia graminis f. sp. tritici CRL 75-36-700-3]|uniref:Uncharacterized protein n=1 Tax=Puccinia graminis f. sp. tritici (strain CRL 75-36-700-3 / race SCCL) TaxID=418459 RepID=E3JQD4_PUCGT|nr:uncharacterized protein PGTG_00619 [Puccinia graminis f. sp. tritici CRL 75-36-700-3]EFP74663.1 hypothetical protein PGTG_00619 [Puccinia graminis f. sp. tritici CRL 75-36-700-3]